MMPNRVADPVIRHADDAMSMQVTDGSAGDLGHYCRSGNRWRGEGWKSLKMRKHSCVVTEESRVVRDLEIDWLSGASLHRY